MEKVAVGFPGLSFEGKRPLFFSLSRTIYAVIEMRQRGKVELCGGDMGAGIPGEGEPLRPVGLSS
jgi:hypothetical protein